MLTYRIDMHWRFSLVANSHDLVAFWGPQSIFPTSTLLTSAPQHHQGLVMTTHSGHCTMRNTDLYSLRLYLYVEKIGNRILT